MKKDKDDVLLVNEDYNPIGLNLVKMPDKEDDNNE